MRDMFYVSVYYWIMYIVVKNKFFEFILGVSLLLLQESGSHRLL